MRQIVVPDEFSFIWEILDCIVHRKKIPIDRYEGVGGRLAGKTTAFILLIALICIFCPGRRFGFALARNEVQDVKEFIENFEQTFAVYDIECKIISSKNRIVVNGHVIKFVGLNNNRKSQQGKKSGFSGFGDVEGYIVWFEERFQIAEKDAIAFESAIRPIVLPGEKTPWSLILSTCNPWAKGSPYIQYCSKHMTWDINILKTKGSQSKIVDIDLGEGRTERVLFHYTNWRVAKGFIPEVKIKQILSIWQYDKRLASVSDYGLPGYEEGAIYTHVLNNIGNAVWQEHEYMLGGGDYGWGRDAANGKTAFYFMGWSHDKGCDIYYEFVSHNHEIVKTPNQVAEAVVMFYLNSMRDYCNRVGWASAFNMRVRVDNMAVGIIQILNDVARKYKLSWLSFIKCKKFPINDRIEVTLSMMGRQRMRMSPNIKLLKQEMEMSYYEETQTQKRAKVNDHGINGFEYAFEDVMHKEARLNGNTEVSMRKSKIW